MNARDYIEGKLRSLASKYCEVQIRYEYRVITKSHLIEIIPLSFFEKNKDYIADEAEIEDEFEKLFPNENIVFISEDSLTEINNLDLELGYKTICIDFSSLLINFEVVGYSTDNANKCSENYAIAA